MFGFNKTKTKYIGVCPNCTIYYESPDRIEIERFMKAHRCTRSEILSTTDNLLQPRSNQKHLDINTYLAQKRNVVDNTQNKAPTVAHIIEKAESDLLRLRDSGVKYDVLQTIRNLIDIVDNLTYVTGADDKRALSGVYTDITKKIREDIRSNKQAIEDLLNKAEALIDNNTSSTEITRFERYISLAEARSRLLVKDEKEEPKESETFGTAMELPEVIEMGAFFADRLFKLGYTKQSEAVNNEITSLQELYRKNI